MRIRCKPLTIWRCFGFDGILKEYGLYFDYGLRFSDFEFQFKIGDSDFYGVDD